MWEHKDTVKLIKMHKENPLLWDPNHEDYKDYFARAKVERDIARSLEKSRWEIKRKIKSLRGMYYRSFKRAKQYGYKHLWFGYKLMSYLEKVYEKIYDKVGVQDVTSEMKTSVTENEESDKSDKSDDDNDSEDDDNENYGNSNKSWTQEEYIKLIDKYKEHPELWDKSHEMYNNKYKILTAIKSIAKDLDKEAPEIKVKLKSIRTIFFRVRKRLNDDVKKYGVFTRKLWFGYRRMSFLVKDNFLNDIEVDEADKPEDCEEDKESVNERRQPHNSEDEEHALSFCWTQSKLSELIAMYKDQPQLWDPDHEYFTDRSKRHVTLKEFASTLNMTKQEVESKIKNLRDQYKRQYNKIKIAEKNNGRYTGRHWFAYDKLAFLAKIYGPTENSVKESDDNDDYDMIKEGVLREEINEEPVNPTDDDDDDNDDDDCSYKKESWSQHSTMQLMDMYKEHPVLWDRHHDMYNSRYMKQRTYQIFSRALGKTVLQIRAKLKALKSVFYHTRDKIRKVVQEHGRFSQKLWFGYEKMSFLDEDNLLTYIEKPAGAQHDDDSEQMRNDDSEQMRNDESEQMRNDESEVLQLIELYKIHPILWNPHDKEYKNVYKKKEIIKHIAKSLNKKPLAVSIKFKNLRTSFWRVHKSKSKGKKENLWHLYDHMSFLADAAPKLRKPIEISIKQEQVHDEDGDDSEDDDYKVDGSDNDDADAINDDSMTSNKSAFQHVSMAMKRVWDENGSTETDLHEDPLQHSPNKKCKKEVDLINIEIPPELGVQNKENSKNQPTNDANVFAQFIAQEMSKITDERLLTMAKIEITQIIFKAQMEQTSKS